MIKSRPSSRSIRSVHAICQQSAPTDSMLQIDIMTLTWAIHRLNGVSSPANAAYSADELRHQLVNSGASCLFTVAPLLPVAIEAAAKARIPKERIYICELPEKATGGAKTP